MLTHTTLLRRVFLTLAILLVIATSDRAYGQYGPILSGSGPVNRSMAGVAVASPLSPSGALYWNPATMSGFSRSEVDFGAEFLLLDTRLSSQYSADVFGPGVPPIGLSGQTLSNSTVYPLPNASVVFRPENSPFSYGLGLTAVAGFGVDYPGSGTNPILTPRPPVGVGVGQVFSDYQVLQINAAVAYQLTDRLSIGASPNVNIGRLQFEPGLFVPPDNANGDPFSSYPAATHTRSVWGAGFTIGLYYQADTWATGLSYKSPQWFERYRYNTTDEQGNPRGASVGLDLPMILSWGLAYTGFDRLVLAADLRYIGFSGAKGFGDDGFLPTGAASGLGFDDTFAVAVGAQYRLTDRLSVLGGYSFGTNPVPDSRSGVNIASPTIIEHVFSAGATWAVTEDFALTVGYLFGPENSISGPLLLPTGPVPGTVVGNSTSFHSITLGASVKFGACRSVHACSITPAE